MSPAGCVLAVIILLASMFVHPVFLIILALLVLADIYFN